MWEKTILEIRPHFLQMTVSQCELSAAFLAKIWQTMGTPGNAEASQSR